MIKADITGHRFGRLTAVRFTGRSGNGGRAWHCACDCGGSIVAYVGKLRDGGVVSCGCSRRKHGLTRSRAQWHPLYLTWALMRNRCSNPKNTNYKNYGGRGIKVCTRWDDFTLFLADVGEKPPGKTIDRIDNDGDYEPGNVKWSTRSEQQRNKRRPSSGWWSDPDRIHPRWAKHPGKGKRIKPVEVRL